MKHIAIVPARSNSKRLRNKNVLEINKKPLIAYTIERALLWGDFDAIYINSEDDNILKIGEKYGAITYKRPIDLAFDTAKVIDVIKEQIHSMCLADDTIITILLPTCPLRTTDDLKAAYSLFVNNHRHNPVVSVTKYEKSPSQSFVINVKGHLVPLYPESYSSRSQDNRDAYRYNCGIIITTVGLFMGQDDIVGISSIPYVMPFYRSIDIDYDYQVPLVEMILRNQEKEVH
jgi:CMP-N-acetylneuraminic acid synthetase